MIKGYWERDDVQFPRLLAEIKAAGLNKRQMEELCASMDLTRADIHDLFDRAEETFEAIKEQLDSVDEVCVCHGTRLNKSSQMFRLLCPRCRRWRLWDRNNKGGAPPGPCLCGAKIWTVEHPYPWEIL